MNGLPNCTSTDKNIANQMSDAVVLDPLLINEYRQLVGWVDAAIVADKPLNR